MAWRPVTQGFRNGYKDGYDDGYYNEPIRHTVYGLNDSYDPDRVPRSDADADGYAMPLDVSGIASPRPPLPRPRLRLHRLGSHKAPAVFFFTGQQQDCKRSNRHDFKARERPRVAHLVP
jgi:hypothetical protein